ncbi:MAG: phosphoribosylamine--glycine ligase [SAR324 cluster bacterium]|nr:phosphoribosylamine--glycine ligase [SAR324 cluster bacterium]
MAPKILVLGVGAFAQSIMRIMRRQQAEVFCYLTRNYGHYGPSQEGQVWDSRQHPSPIPVIQQIKPDLIIPMSIDWHTSAWSEELLAQNIPVFCPKGTAIQLEVDRAFARDLCREYGVPFPSSYRVQNRIEALSLMKKDPKPYVIKNPLCSPFSPVHTVVCESIDDTLGWLDRIDYAEGVFLQEYLGTAEAGHFVFVSDGEIFSIATNQEYKRAFNQNMGPVAGAPMGGLVEQDPQDKYGLAKELIMPLQPWLKANHFYGPLQVTAIRYQEQWHAIEYNVRLGVTSGALFLSMLENSLEVVLDIMRATPPKFHWNAQKPFGCSLSLAGYGYPYVVPQAPSIPVTVSGSPDPDCDIWWNEVEQVKGQLHMRDHKVAEMGHRIADVNVCGSDLQEVIQKTYANIRKIRCLASYYRTDVGQSLWPPGTGY